MEFISIGKPVGFEELNVRVKDDASPEAKEAEKGFLNYAKIGNVKMRSGQERLSN